jgi:hypothetical protein
MFINYTTIPLKRGPSSFFVWYTRISCNGRWLLRQSFTLSHRKEPDQKRSGGPQKLFILTVRGQRFKNHGTYHSSFKQWYPNEATLIQLLLKIIKESDILKILNPQSALQKHSIHTLESSKHPLNLLRLSL